MLLVLTLEISLKLELHFKSQCVTYRIHFNTSFFNNSTLEYLFIYTPTYIFRIVDVNTKHAIINFFLPLKTYNIF